MAVADDDDVARVLLVVRRDVAAGGDRKQRHRRRVLRLGAADDQPLHVLVAVGDRVGGPSPKLMRCMNAAAMSMPGTFSLQVLRVGGLQVLAHPDLLRAGGPTPVPAGCG